ncbi:M56 family metallopeptidase [Psychroflexus aestuariivivens]|uniref:M56 family metallopeptidase n=1 Tax=Psychroflexus aestuariivivens TaxID=1795040 RepID=UPI000FDA6A22|nr:M56 family metallopeptidase [Psychroflexus aestuariivivens]
MWLYFVEVIVFQACFLMLFQVFKTETFHQYNRIYLLVSVLLSIAIPLLDLGFISKLFYDKTSDVDFTIQVGQYFAVAGNSEISTGSTGILQNSWHWQDILLLIYGLGLTFFSIKSVFSFFKLFKIMNSAKFQKYLGDAKFYKLQNSASAFTFWRSIFVGDQIDEKALPKIIVHEQHHAKLRHSLDLILIEITKIVFWFSPFHYWLKRELVLIHEYQADRKASEHDGKFSYTQNLLNVAFGTKQFHFSHSFFDKSQLKQRLMMLQKNHSKSQNLLKYILVLPLLILMLTYTACKDETKESLNEITNQNENEQLIEKYKQELDEAILEYGSLYAKDLPEKFKIQNDIDSKEAYYRNSAYMLKLMEQMNTAGKTSDEKFTEMKAQLMSKTYEEYLDNQDSSNKSVKYETSGIPYSEVDLPPRFESCKDLIDKSAIQECNSEKITQIVNANFKTSDIGQFNLKPKVVRVYVRFLIDKNGDIQDIQARAPHPELEKRAKEVISKLPKMIPGENEGQKVNTYYALPISMKNPK